MSTTHAAEQYCFFEPDTDLLELSDEMKVLMKNAKAPNTLKAYGHEWKVFNRWCEQHGRRALPADSSTLGLFATWEGRTGYSIETIRLGITAINYFHAAQGFASPFNSDVREVVSGIARKQARAADPNHRAGKDALQVLQLQKICRALEEGRAADVRDRAIILVGFASAWRRSELTKLQIEHVTLEPDYAILRLGYSKSDQEGKGRETMLRRGERAYTCPVRALEAWIKVRGKQAGPLFTRCTPRGRITSTGLGGQGICAVLKRALARVGETPAMYGAHSLRSGMITAADERKVSLRDIMDHTGHKRVDTLMRYIKRRNTNPLAGVL